MAKYLWRGMTFNDWLLKHDPDKNLLMNALRMAGLGFRYVNTRIGVNPCKLRVYAAE